MSHAGYTQDRELALRALAGDERALSRVGAIISDLAALALRKLESQGVRVADPENVAAEVKFLVIVRDPHKTLGNYQGRSSLRTFLWQVVKCRTIDLVRRQRLNPQTEPLEDAEGARSEPMAERYRDITRAVFDYIERQEPEVRLILEGRWLDELSYKEIVEKARRELSQTLSLESIGAVLFQHRKKLAENLKKLGLISD